MIAPERRAAHPKVKLFGTTPIRSEPTGITFSSGLSLYVYFPATP